MNKSIRTIINGIDRKIRKSGSNFSKLFVWIYAFIFIVCGIFTIITLLITYTKTGKISYADINGFINNYFSPAVAGTFTIIGVLLIDKDRDGIPDKWDKLVSYANKDNRDNKNIKENNDKINPMNGKQMNDDITSDNETTKHLNNSIDTANKDSKENSIKKQYTYSTEDNIDVSTINKKGK